MTDFFVEDPRSAAPLSDPADAQDRALQRLARAVRDLQRIAARQTLPRGFMVTEDDDGDLWVVDRARRRRARLTDQAWEPTTVVG